jgi:hypothetical protein
VVLGMEHEQLADQRRDHLTAILGYAQLLQRRIALCPNLTPAEREALRLESGAIEQAAIALQRTFALPASPQAAAPPDPG